MFIGHFAYLDRLKYLCAYEFRQTGSKRAGP